VNSTLQLVAMMATIRGAPDRMISIIDLMCRLMIMHRSQLQRHPTQKHYALPAPMCSGWVGNKAVRSMDIVLQGDGFTGKIDAVLMMMMMTMTMKYSGALIDKSNSCSLNCFI